MEASGQGETWSRDDARAEADEDDVHRSTRLLPIAELLNTIRSAGSSCVGEGAVWGPGAMARERVGPS